MFDCEGNVSVDRELREKVLQEKMSIEELKLSKPRRAEVVSHDDVT
jgi:hypothetical protein